MLLDKTHGLLQNLSQFSSRHRDSYQVGVVPHPPHPLRMPSGALLDSAQGSHPTIECHYWATDAMSWDSKHWLWLTGTLTHTIFDYDYVAGSWK